MKASDTSPGNNSKIDNEIRSILFGASGGVSDMAEEELQQIKSLIASELERTSKEAQLSILRGFRRRDFVRDDFYESAVLDRIQIITTKESTKDE